MRLKQYINELALRKQTDFTVRLDNKRNFKVKIVLDIEHPTNWYGFEAVVFNYEDFELDYDSLPENIEKDIEKVNKKDIYKVPFWRVIFTDKKGETKQKQLSDKKQALQLFAALEKIMKDFLKKNPPVIYFTADTSEQSRVKLYDTIFRRFKDGSYNKAKGDFSGDEVYFFWRKN